MFVIGTASVWLYVSVVLFRSNADSAQLWLQPSLQTSKHSSFVPRKQLRCLRHEEVEHSVAEVYGTCLNSVNSSVASHHSLAAGLLQLCLRLPYLLPCLTGALSFILQDLQSAKSGPRSVIFSLENRLMYQNRFFSQFNKPFIDLGREGRMAVRWKGFSCHLLSHMRSRVHQWC